MLPVFDRDREFLFIEANKQDYTQILITSFLIFGLLVLFFKYKTKRQYHD